MEHIHTTYDLEKFRVTWEMRDVAPDLSKCTHEECNGDVAGSVWFGTFGVCQKHLEEWDTYHRKRLDDYWKNLIEKGDEY